jgi:hypothetical protein
VVDARYFIGNDCNQLVAVEFLGENTEHKELFYVRNHLRPLSLYISEYSVFTDVPCFAPELLSPDHRYIR